MRALTANHQTFLRMSHTDSNNQKQKSIFLRNGQGDGKLRTSSQKNGDKAEMIESDRIDEQKKQVRLLQNETITKSKKRESATQPAKLLEGEQTQKAYTIAKARNHKKDEKQSV